MDPPPWTRLQWIIPAEPGLNAAPGTGAEEWMAQGISVCPCSLPCPLSHDKNRKFWVISCSASLSSSSCSPASLPETSGRNLLIYFPPQMRESSFGLADVACLSFLLSPHLPLNGQRWAWLGLGACQEWGSPCSVPFGISWSHLTHSQRVSVAFSDDGGHHTQSSEPGEHIL